MKKLDKEMIKTLSDTMMIGLSAEETDLILKDQSFYDLIQFMEAVDTKDVEMMHLPFEEETTYLREDVVNHQLERETIMINAPKHNEEFIEVVQVINK